MLDPATARSGSSAEVTASGSARPVGATLAPAEKTLVEDHLGCVGRLLREYRVLGIDPDELRAEGHLGLVEAAWRFDRGRGVQFATYASWWIRKRLGVAVARQTGVVRIPRYRLDRLRRIRSAERELAGRLSRPADIGELAEAVDLDREEVGRLRSLRRREVSLDDVLDPESGLRISDTLASPVGSWPDAPLLEEEGSASVWRLVGRLSNRERLVLTMRFGLDDGEPRTLAEIGRTLRLSRERVRQIEERALRELRRQVSGSRLIARVGRRRGGQSPSARSAVTIPTR